MNLSVLLGSSGELAMGGRMVLPLNGVEERLPFADRRLFEFMQAVPAVLKGSEAREKERKLLRAAFAEVEPMQSTAPYSGAFPGFPWWLLPWLKRLVEDQAKLLADEAEVLNSDAVRLHLRKYRRRGARADRKRTWLLFVLQTWLDLHLNGRDPFAAVEV